MKRKKRKSVGIFEMKQMARPMLSENIRWKFT